jgi:hypothetical protein
MNRLLALLLALALGCASSCRTLEHCTEDDVRAAVAPAPECEADEQVAALRASLRKRIEGGADPLAIQVSFGDRSTVSSVCAVRSRAPLQWAAFSYMHEAIPGIRGSNPGPSCLAGRTWTFNRYGVLLGEVQALIRDCREQTVVGEFYPRCLDLEQGRRGELWFFKFRTRTPYIFVKSENAASRRQAIDRCSYDLHFDVLAGDDPVGTTRNYKQLIECVGELGWVPALPDKYYEFSDQKRFR